MTADEELLLSVTELAFAAQKEALDDVQWRV
jgi:hypothetical protein